MMPSTILTMKLTIPKWIWVTKKDQLVSATNCNGLNGYRLFIKYFYSGRWDFDTQEEYSDYMSTKEALPKAAFQYGVKMQDGRKTRKNKTEKSEKAELDREWQKIQSIMNKRKNKGGDEPDFKVPRH